MITYKIKRTGGYTNSWHHRRHDDPTVSAITSIDQEEIKVNVPTKKKSGVSEMENKFLSNHAKKKLLRERAK